MQYPSFVRARSFGLLRKYTTYLKGDKTQWQQRLDYDYVMTPRHALFSIIRKFLFCNFLKYIIILLQAFNFSKIFATQSMFSSSSSYSNILDFNCRLFVREFLKFSLVRSINSYFFFCIYFIPSRDS